MNRVLTGIFLVTLAAACSPISKKGLTKSFVAIEKKFQDHTGFVIYDLKKEQTAFSFNGEKYFTPASNTKIFTFFTSLNVLGDSIPGLYYTIKSDSLIFWGTGDPSFFYDEVVASDRVYKFLKDRPEELYFSSRNFATTPLGPGWAWSDYNYTFSSERSSLPIYGNAYAVTQSATSSLKVSPSYFKKYFWLADSVVRSSAFIRDVGSNRTDYFPGRINASSRQWKVPFRTEALVIANLLEDTLKRKVSILSTPVPKSDKHTLFSVPSDSLYKVMMQESDNFIAEQLLLVCAGVLSDTLKPEIAIRYAKKNLLTDLPDNPVWVDGSGLSRYNLFTPRSVVKLWERVYRMVDRERLFPLLAIGGKTGTIRNLYKNDPPYIFGKTGTLSNNHSLSGYLVTKKGETLIFSFMSNNYTVPASEVRKDMERVLMQFYTNY